MKRITPSPGHWLTQRGELPDHARVVTKCVILAHNASADDWREIPEAQARAIIDRREATEPAAIPSADHSDD